MKVFVTGATGFVGRYVVKELLEKGFDVHAGTRDPHKAAAILGERVKTVRADFDGKGSVRNVLLEIRPDAVVHLIGILNEMRSQNETFDQVHRAIPHELYAAAKEADVRKIAHMSALGVHPDAPSHYHSTKLAGEKELLDSGLAYTIFRPSVIIGPEQRLFSDMKKYTAIAPIVPLPGGGGNMMQPVDVRDVACSFVSSLLNSGTDRKIYELCGPDRLSFREILEKIFSIWGKEVLFLSLPKSVMSLAGKTAEAFMDNPPITSDLVRMMWKDNVCGIFGNAEADGVAEVCGRSPRAFHESLAWALSEGPNRPQPRHAL